MSVPVIVVVSVVGMVTLVAIAAVVAQLLARLQRLARDLAELEQTVLPHVERLQRDADVTGRELERIGQALDGLSERRAGR